MSDFYVYTYSDPDTGVPFYVGKGRGDRIFQHLRPKDLKRRTHFHQRLRAMLIERRIPRIEYAQTRLSEQDAFALERDLIQKYGRLDLGTGSLCNQTEGGEGASGYRHSLKVRQRMSDLASAREHTAEAIASRRDGNMWRAKAIESFNPLSGNVIKTFDSLNAAKRAGFCTRHIADCINGRRKTHRDYGWRYVN